MVFFCKKTEKKPKDCKSVKYLFCKKTDKKQRNR